MDQIELNIILKIHGQSIKMDVVSDHNNLLVTSKNNLNEGLLFSYKKFVTKYKIVLFILSAVLLFLCISYYFSNKINTAPHSSLADFGLEVE